MTASVLLAFAGAAMAAALAIAVLWRGRRSLPRWSFAAGALALAAESLFTGLSANAVTLDALVCWQMRAFVPMAFLPGCWLLFSLTYARGNYREFLVRWQFVLAAAAVLPAVPVLASPEQLILAAGKLPGETRLLLRLGSMGSALHLALLLSAVLALVNLERTFRAAVGTMRWRIKSMILALGVLFAARAYSSSQTLLFHGGELSLQGVNSGALVLACLLVTRALTRAGHFEVSLYPSHSLLHRSLTILLAGAYLFIVGVFAKVVSALGGDAAFPLQAFFILLALVGLTLLLLSDRVRLLTGRLVSRHFQRPVHDYRMVWRTFTEGTACRLQQSELAHAIVNLVSEIFQALSVSLWLVNERNARLALAASTSLSGADGELATEEAVEALRACRRSEPVDLESCNERWAAALRRLNPGEFKHGGRRICVSLVAGGDALGLLVLGDRVGGAHYSVQDFELLKSLGDHAAASLLSSRLSERLAQAKQMEGFQAMSAFFVHDLKNTASTLSLMLQNLPIHYQDPDFRQDALQDIARTVSHLKELISRLNELRHELEVRVVECDLNELVAEALRSHEHTPGVEVVKELRPLPKLQVDPVQIRKVIANLVLNARDALGTGGRIRVETDRHDGWAILAVADNGCGMAPEFIQNCLFRPFQTTKPNGLGIGMFHCRTIVEAHRGRIEVESERGKGTAFRVLLPAPVSG